MIITKNKGISAAEILIVIGIIGVILSIAIPSLISFKKQQVLENTAVDIVSLLNQARSNTISSKNLSAYGVHFEEDKMVLFMGPDFIESSITNEEFLFDNFVSLQSENINLNGGGTNIVFEKITGGTNNYGSLVISLTSDESKTKTIEINKLGIININ